MTKKLILLVFILVIVNCYAVNEKIKMARVSEPNLLKLGFIKIPKDLFKAVMFFGGCFFIFVVFFMWHKKKQLSELNPTQRKSLKDLANARKNRKKGYVELWCMSKSKMKFLGFYMGNVLDMTNCQNIAFALPREKWFWFPSYLPDWAFFRWIKEALDWLDFLGLRWDIQLLKYPLSNATIYIKNMQSQYKRKPIWTKLKHKFKEPIRFEQGQHPKKRVWIIAKDIVEHPSLGCWLPVIYDENNELINLGNYVSNLDISVNLVDMLHDVLGVTNVVSKGVSNADTDFQKRKALREEGIPTTRQGQEVQ